LKTMHQELVPAFSIKLNETNHVARELISGSEKLNFLTVRKNAYFRCTDN